MEHNPPLTSDICPLSSDICLLSSDIRLLSSVLYLLLNSCRLKNIIQQQLFSHIENSMSDPYGHPYDNPRL